MSSVTVSVAMPPDASSASTRITADVPQEKAGPHASLQDKRTLKKKRWSSGHTDAQYRFA